jgi:hypothetical protein
VGRGAQVLELLASEDVDGNQMDLGVAVLARLGGRHVDNLAGTALDHDVTVLAQGGTLHREGRRRTGVDRLEGVIMLERKESARRCQDRCCRIEADKQMATGEVVMKAASDLLGVCASRRLAGPSQCGVVFDAAQALNQEGGSKDQYSHHPPS